MAWVDSMRLRRNADMVRALGWLNLVVSIIVSLFHASEGLVIMVLFGVWAALVMAVTHGIAWMIDRRAERVVRR